jgi:hypothetical protein
MTHRHLPHESFENRPLADALSQFVVQPTSSEDAVMTPITVNEVTPEAPVENPANPVLAVNLEETPALVERRSAPARRSPRRAVAATLLGQKDRRERQTVSNMVDPKVFFNDGDDVTIHNTMVTIITALRLAGLTPTLRIVIAVENECDMCDFALSLMKGSDDGQRIKLTGIGGEGLFGRLFLGQELFRDEVMGHCDVKQSRTRQTNGLRGFLSVWSSLQ